MEVEDQLSLESAKYNEIVRTRITQLQEKNEEQRKRIILLGKEGEALANEIIQLKKANNELHSSLKTSLLEIKLTKKDIQIKDDKLKELK